MLYSASCLASAAVQLVFCVGRELPESAGFLTNYLMSPRLKLATGCQIARQPLRPTLTDRETPRKHCSYGNQRNATGPLRNYFPPDLN